MNPVNETDVHWNWRPVDFRVTELVDRDDRGIAHVSAIILSTTWFVTYQHNQQHAEVKNLHRA